MNTEIKTFFLVPFQKNDIVFHAAQCHENNALSSNKIQYYLIVVALASTSLIIVLSFSLFSQVKNDTTYFPLALGNRWIYKSSVFSTLDTMIVTDTQRVKDKLYYGITDYSKPLVYWLRYDSGKVFLAPSLNLDSGTSKVMEDTVYDFSAPLGSEWTINLPFSDSFLNCEIDGFTRLFNNNSTVTTPVGAFKNCFMFLHEPYCDDAGITEQWFARGVGRVKYFHEYIWGEDTIYLINTNFPTRVSNTERPQPQISYRLSQNYPNPFNPSTTISFNLPMKSSVSLIIFDLIGREVTTLVNEELPAGSYTRQWNAVGVSSGVYYYRLQSGSYTQTKKLVLLR